MPTCQRSVRHNGWSGGLGLEVTVTWGPHMAGGCQNTIIKGLGVSPDESMSPPDRMLFFPRWLADFKEAGDGKSNADMSKIRPLRQKIWPLGTGWLWLETRLAKSFVIDISGMCSEKGKSERWQATWGGKPSTTSRRWSPKSLVFRKQNASRALGSSFDTMDWNSRSFPNRARQSWPGDVWETLKWLQDFLRVPDFNTWGTLLLWFHSVFVIVKESRCSTKLLAFLKHAKQ